MKMFNLEKKLLGTGWEMGRGKRGKEKGQGVIIYHHIVEGILWGKILDFCWATELKS